MPQLKKGSAAAKAYMAKIRAKKSGGSKTSGLKNKKNEKAVLIESDPNLDYDVYAIYVNGEYDRREKRKKSKKSFKSKTSGIKNKYDFKIITVYPDRVIVRDDNGKTAVAYYKDSEGMYIFNKNLDKQYFYYYDPKKSITGTGYSVYKSAPADVKKLVDSLENMYDANDIRKVVTALAKKGYYIEMSMDGSVEVFRKIKPKAKTGDPYYFGEGTKKSNLHKDTKSHNVNIKVVSGMKKNKNLGAVYENTMPTGKKMYARIDEDAYLYVGNINSSKLREYVKQNANKWVEIDTKFLFSDQYNTTDGYRIYDTMINAIKNDARVGVKEFENDDSCCFLIWKGVKPVPLPLPESIDKLAKRLQWKNPTYQIGSYSLELFQSKHYMLQNARQRIKFLYWNKMYFTTSGIGYKAKKSLSLGYPISYPIPDNVKRKVDQILNSL